MEEPKFDVFLITHNHIELTIRCLEALYKYTNVPFRLTIIDDSTDCTPLWIKGFAEKHDNVQYLRPKEKIRSGQHAWNIALKKTDLPYIVCMVNSITVEPNWLESAFDLIQRRKDVGLVGFKILNHSGTIQCSSVMGIFENGIMAVNGKDEPGHRCTFISQVPAVGGALILVRREAILPEFADDYIGFRGWDDLDICLSLRQKDWDVIYCGYGSAYHIDSPTKKEHKNFWPEYEANKKKFLEKWNFVIK